MTTETTVLVEYKSLFNDDTWLESAYDTIDDAIKERPNKVIFLYTEIDSDNLNISFWYHQVNGFIYRQTITVKHLLPIMTKAEAEKKLGCIIEG